ncbi:MAG: hypothetical protein ACT4O1_10510 [Gemmatimonadota bacterium]
MAIGSGNLDAKLSKLVDIAIGIASIAVLAVSVAALTSDGKGIRAALRERKKSRKNAR